MVSVQRESSCSMRTDRQTDMTKTIVACLNIANASKNDKISAGTHVNKISDMKVRKVLLSLQRFP